jgi:DNA invertase Pin-like site-specific DNA recombinase
LKHLEVLTSYGVAWKSFTEQYFDSCGIFRDAVISIAATLAKQERLKISERTVAGLERARKQGRGGRPSEAGAGPGPGAAAAERGEEPARDIRSDGVEPDDHGTDPEDRMNQRRILVRITSVCGPDAGRDMANFTIREPFILCPLFE